MGTATGISLLARRPAVLVLADGTVFQGAAFGAECVRTGEVCFNTSLTGYQEILTDPSYAGQLVAMTCTQIGNVGVNAIDDESERPWLSGFIVRELFSEPSNWRSQAPLDSWLAEQGIPGLADIDTRALVRRIRDHGFQNAALSTDPARQDVDALLEAARGAPDLSDVDLVGAVTCEHPYEWTEGTWMGVEGQLPPAEVPEQRFRVAALDFGVKRNILRLLVDHGFDVTVLPASATPDEVAEVGPDAVFLSNGPGDPAVLTEVAANVRVLVDRYPTFGICLGHQILGHALGGTTKKLKFGHHGGNQPGQDLHTGKVAICAENHGYAVDAESLRDAGEPVEITHVNLNDGTVEGLAHLERPVFSVQYHPEASPGPHDAAYFFARFRRMVEAVAAGESVTGASIAQES